jgi:tetratricopeptide (TPR) repeat protein
MAISQSIGDIGNGYQLQMRALDCASGATLAKEQADIGKRDEVVHELGVTAARLRAKLGEPADSLARFNQPLETALSPSLEALQAASQGNKLSIAGDVDGALKPYQRAVELDPNLAVTHERMGARPTFSLAKLIYRRLPTRVHTNSATDCGKKTGWPSKSPITVM